MSEHNNQHSASCALILILLLCSIVSAQARYTAVKVRVTTDRRGHPVKAESLNRSLATSQAVSRVMATFRGEICASKGCTTEQIILLYFRGVDDGPWEVMTVRRCGK